MLGSLVLPGWGFASHSDNGSFIVVVGITSSLQWVQHRTDGEAGGEVQTDEYPHGSGHRFRHQLY